MKRTTLLAAAAAFALAGALPSRAAAQPTGPGKILSVNPFLPLAGYFQGEFEGRVRDNLSLAVSGAHMKLEDRYTSVDVKARFYPSGRALHGFGLSMGIGVGKVENDDFFADCVTLPSVGRCEPRRGQSTTGPTASVEAQYQWLLGKRRNTAVAVGGGLKRYYIDDTDANGYDYFQEYTPTLRLTIGYAFR